MMNVKKVEVGFLKENCYIVSKGNNCLIIDPGDEYEKIKKEIKNLNVLAVLITHGHFDHIGALESLLNDYNIDIIRFDSSNENEYSIGCFDFEKIHTPGHSHDSVCYYFKEENIMFVGDFIFKNNIGRCDLPGGDLNKMYKSLQKIKSYPDVIIYPGHGPLTSLNIEKRDNPYFKIEQL